MPSRLSQHPGVVVVLALCLLAAVIALLAVFGPEPCEEWDGWRFETRYPKPEHCMTQDVQP